MACNGFNHPPDCDCNFRGGHAGTQPPRRVEHASLFGDLAPARERPPQIERRSRRCPKCGLPIFYVPVPRGGRFLAAGDGSFLKHNCEKQVPERPIRLARAKWRREWFPVFIRSVRTRQPCQILQVIGLAEGKPFRVQVLDSIAIDDTHTAVCRWSPDDSKVLEISYVDSHTGELTGTCIRAKRIRG